MMNENFYQNLPVLNNYSDVADFSNYHAIPSDWHIIVSDVTGSTEAIGKGKYKEVNILGAALITAVKNIAKPLEIPFVFGGDGASLCVPESLIKKVTYILGDIRQLALQEFGLDFRVGVVPVTKIYEENKKLLVAKFSVSEHYVQAVFSGGGLDFAEDFLKKNFDDKFKNRFESSSTPQIDLSGLECRWDHIRSKHDEIISLLVKTTGNDEKRNSEINREIINKIIEIYDETESHPVFQDNLRMTLNNKKLSSEYNVRTFGKRIFERIRYWFDLRFKILIGKYFMAKNISTSETSWGEYKSDLAANTDFRKYDDMIRQVLSGTKEMRYKLTEYLESRHRNGEIVYGIHSSPFALITCIVEKYQSNHFHFVDGSNGGYAEAAKQMKEQISLFGY